MAAFIRSLSIIFLYSLTVASFAAGVDLYEELGLSKTASKAEIKKAYRDLAKKWHPDKSSEENAQEKFMRITKAHEILMNDEKRKHYDFFGSDDIDGSPLGDKEFSFTFGEHTFTFGGSNKPKSKEVLTLQRYQEEILKAASNKRYIVYVFTEYCYSCKPFSNVWAELETEFTSQGIGYGVFDENLDMRLAAMLGMSTRVAPVIVGICNGNLQWLEDRHLTKESVMHFATSPKLCANVGPANTFWKRLPRNKQHASSVILIVMAFIVISWFLLSRRSRSTPVEVTDLTCMVLLKLTWKTSSTRRAPVDINVITRLSNESETREKFSQVASLEYFDYPCTNKEPHTSHDFELYVKDADGKPRRLAQCTQKCPHAIASCSRRHLDESSNGQWQPQMGAAGVLIGAPQVSNSLNSPSLPNVQSHPSGSVNPDNRPLTNSRYDPLPEPSTPRRRVNSAERPKNTSQRQETEVANFREVQGGAMRNNLNPVIAAGDGYSVDDSMEFEPDNRDNSEDNSLDKTDGGDDEAKESNEEVQYVKKTGEDRADDVKEAAEKQSSNDPVLPECDENTQQAIAENKCSINTNKIPKNPHSSAETARKGGKSSRTITAEDSAKTAEKGDKSSLIDAGGDSAKTAEKGDGSSQTITAEDSAKTAEKSDKSSLIDAGRDSATTAEKGDGSSQTITAEDSAKTAEKGDKSSQTITAEDSAKTAEKSDESSLIDAGRDSAKLSEKGDKSSRTSTAEGSAKTAENGGKSSQNNAVGDFRDESHAEIS